MKKLLMILLVCSLMHASAQFKPDYNKNFWEQAASWRNYYDSLKQSRTQQGITHMKGTGQGAFIRWQNSWKNVMPASGDFAEAKKIYVALEEAQRQQATQTSRVSVNWTEVGTKQYSNIRHWDGSTWINSHVAGNIKRLDASVGKFDRLFKHPTNANTLFACAGNVEDSGGGLWVSTDYGLNWTVAGTDKIPNGNVACFSVKPASSAPYAGTEIWFVGLVSGNVYRSSDQGATWTLINNGQIDSWADPNNNLIKGIYNHQVLFIPDATNAYGVAVVAGFNGLYYSTNYGDPNAANVTWTKFNVTLPPNYDPSAVTANTFYDITDAEYYVKSGTHYIVANMVKVERNATYNILGYRNYILQSSFTPGSHAAANLTTLGAISNPNTFPNIEFASANIEVMSSNPNYVYVSYLDNIINLQVIYRYNISTGVWTDLSVNDLTGNGLYNDAHCFAIEPSNDNNYYIISNNERKYVSGLKTHDVSGYSDYKHADSRDVLIDVVGTQTNIWVGTDGGIYVANEANWNFIPRSEGLNATQTDQVSVAQKPPFYVVAAPWHGGGVILDPSTSIWHNWSFGDGNYSHTTFLNPNKVYFWDQNLNPSFLTGGYNSNSSGTFSILNGLVACNIITSENVPGLAFAGGINNNLYISTNDMATYTSHVVTGYNSGSSIPNRIPDYRIIPNDPDRLLIAACDYNGLSPDNVYILKDVRTTPVVEQIIPLNNITIGSNNYTSDFYYGAGIVVDAVNPNIFRLVFRSSPSVASPYIPRVVEHDRSTGVWTDLTYTMESFSNFPEFVIVNSIEQDRQTGTLYIGTALGVYYLDESVPTNKIWRKYSTNLPSIGNTITINHCQGELYTAAHARGVWKAPLYRPANSAREWHITTNTTWTERKNLFCTLVVDPGVTLEIKGELVVYGYQRIVVKRGGTLLIDGGKITSECGNLWQGIYVEGNSTAGQTVTTSTQGMCKMINNAILENSHNGIANYALDASGVIDWSRIGGIIECTNSKFYNNRRAVEFQMYSFATSVSKFIDCIFETNKLIDPVNFPNNNGIEAFVTMNAINGVLFEGNTFRNTYATGIPGTNFGIGIGANESVFTVKKNAAFVGNTFQNLFRGIQQTRTSATAGTLIIEDNTFTETRTGIFLSGNSTSNEIRSNVFTKAALPPYTTSNAYYGLWIDATRDFNLVNNTIQNQTFGVYVKNSSLVSEPICNIYGNVFNNNFRAIVSQNNNFKLKIRCNTFGNLNSVAQMYWLNYNGITAQGSCSSATQPAGNIFSDPVPVEKDIFNYTGANSFTYFHHNNQVFPYIANDIIPVISPSGVSVTLSACSYTFDPAMTCDYILPAQGPDNSTQMTLLNGNGNEKYSNASEQVYQSVMKKIKDGTYPTDLSGSDLAELHKVAMEDSTVVGANARNIFIFFFKEEFEHYEPYLVSAPADGNDQPALANGPHLFQNIPNPTGDETEIKAYLPGKTGLLEIRNFSGQLIKSFTLTEENNRIKINKGELGFGVYFYSLKVNDALIDTKKMVIIQ